MKRTLKVTDVLLRKARKLHRLGLHLPALRILTRLGRLRDLPPRRAGEVQRRLAHLHLRCRRLRRCRKHLSAALVHQPDDARCHYLLGQVIAADVRCDPRRALSHYRRALQLEPDNPRPLSALGLLAVQQDQMPRGLAALRRATRLAPDDPVVLRRHVRALWYLRRPQEAGALLRTALFRNPANLLIRQLWEDFQFRLLRQRQRRRQLLQHRDTEPCLLPFAISSDLDQDNRTIRVDGPATLAAPHLRLSAWRSDQRFA